MRLALTAALAVLVGTFSAQAQTTIVTCSLIKASDEFKGTCSVPCSVNNLAIDIDGINPRRACDGPPRVVEASLKPAQNENWLGRMQGKEPEDPTRFELTKGKDAKLGVAKLPYGWFALSQSRLEGEILSLTINASKQLPPTQDDVKIIQRALALIPNPEAWNKQDNRQCPQGQTKVSLFCALQIATTEISGGVHYRQPALQAVREMLNEVGADRVKLHRIMDYNNHPDTTLQEIHTLLKRSQGWIENRFR